MAQANRLADEWLPAVLARSNADLEVCVIDWEGISHARHSRAAQETAGSIARQKSPWISSRRIGAVGLLSTKSKGK
jgi:hypothetical protein